MKNEKEKVLAHLSMGDSNRLIFFQNIFKIIGTDAEIEFDKNLFTQGSQGPLLNNSKMSKLKPISLSFNIFQNYNALKKRNNSSLSKPPKANSLNDADICLRGGHTAKYVTNKSKAQSICPRSGNI